MKNHNYRYDFGLSTREHMGSETLLVQKVGTKKGQTAGLILLCNC